MTKEQAIEKAVVVLGYEHEEEPREHVTVARGAGHSGRGWYGWNAEYPDDGSVFLGPVSP